jgi:hypothetical protein
MPFGKHKGERVADVPRAYLIWVLENCHDLPPCLRQAIRDELQGQVAGGSLGRSGKKVPSWLRVAEQEQELVHLRRQLHKAEAGQQVWRSCWRRLAMLAHPDRGGSNELMSLLTQVNCVMGRT